MLAARLLLYLVITLVALKVGHQTGDLLLPPDHVHGVEISPKDVVVSLSVALIVTFFGILDAQLGGRALLGLLIGRYLRPRSEMRLFLVADLVGSTRLAERIGHERFLDYLNDVFSDIAGPVIRERGSIYRYVGDQVIVTWRYAEGLADARALRCALSIGRVLRARAGYYAARHGHEPQRSCALHGGQVASGEVGTLKREIVYLGDTVNTVAHMEELGSWLDEPVLISADLLSRMTLPREVSAVSVSTIRPKGKDRDVEVFAIRPRHAVRSPARGSGAELQSAAPAGSSSCSADTPNSRHIGWRA